MIAMDNRRSFPPCGAKANAIELTIKSDDVRVPEHPTFTGCNWRRVG